MKINHNILQKSRSILPGFAALFLGMYLAAHTTALYSSAISGQEKSFEKRKGSMPGPVELVDIKMEQRSVGLSEKFSAGEDWLKGVEFKLRNVSKKKIIYIELDLNFPETVTGGNEMSFRISLGKRPGSSLTNSKAALLVEEEEEISFVLDEAQYKRLTNFIEPRQPMSSINTVTMEIGFIIFSDGITAWGAGNYYRQDPHDPNHYTNVGINPPDN